MYWYWVSIYTPEAATLIPFSLPILSPTVNAFSPATFWLRLNNLSRRRRFSPATAASDGWRRRSPISIMTFLISMSSGIWTSPEPMSSPRSKTYYRSVFSLSLSHTHTHTTKNTVAPSFAVENSKPLTVLPIK